MSEKTDEEVIAEVAQELIDGINKQETRKEEHKVCDVDTLCDWGLLGMLTARDIATAFVGKALYSVRQAERKKHEVDIKEMKLCFKNGMSEFCPTKGCTNSICPLNNSK